MYPLALRLAVALLLALLPPIARPADAADPRTSAPPQKSTWLRAARLLDDPTGVRSRVEASGFAVQAFYTEFLGWRARGGTRPDKGWGTSGSYDIFAQLDFEELAARPGLQMLTQLKGNYDESINREVAALSDPVDDADFDEEVYVSQLWLQQALWRQRVAVRIGFVEQATAFDRNAVANSEDRQFSSTFLDNNALVPLPNGLGAVVWLRVAPWLEVALGITDADNQPRNAGFHTAFDDFDGLTELAEVTFRGALPGSTLPGSYRIGAFRDGRLRPVFGSGNSAPHRRRGHYGLYCSFDQVVFREPRAGEQGLTLFGRMGWADEDVNRLDWFGSLGVAYQGLLPGRGDDELGVGGYYAAVSDRFSGSRAGAFRSEIAAELYYSFPTLPWLVVTPHLQYIASPSGERGVRDAVVALLRIRVSL